MKFYRYLPLLFVLAASIASCKKEEPTIAVVRTVTELGLPVEGALVRLYPEPSDIQANELIEEVETLTDAAGEAVFDFSDSYEQGQAGFAVLNIEATIDTFVVDGIIKIDPEVTSEQVIVMY